MVLRVLAQKWPEQEPVHPFYGHPFLVAGALVHLFALLTPFPLGGRCTNVFPSVVR